MKTATTTNWNTSLTYSSTPSRNFYCLSHCIVNYSVKSILEIWFYCDSYGTKSSSYCEVGKKCSRIGEEKRDGRLGEGDPNIRNCCKGTESHWTCLTTPKGMCKVAIDINLTKAQAMYKESWEHNYMLCIPQRQQNYAFQSER